MSFEALSSRFRSFSENFRDILPPMLSPILNVLYRAKEHLFFGQNLRYSFISLLLGSNIILTACNLQPKSEIIPEITDGVSNGSLTIKPTDVVTQVVVTPTVIPEANATAIPVTPKVIPTAEVKPTGIPKLPATGTGENKIISKEENFKIMASELKSKLEREADVNNARKLIYTYLNLVTDGNFLNTKPNGEVDLNTRFTGKSYTGKTTMNFYLDGYPLIWKYTSKDDIQFMSSYIEVGKANIDMAKATSHRIFKNYFMNGQFIDLSSMEFIVLAKNKNDENKYDLLPNNLEESLNAIGGRLIDVENHTFTFYIPTVSNQGIFFYVVDWRILENNKRSSSNPGGIGNYAASMGLIANPSFVVNPSRKAEINVTVLVNGKPVVTRYDQFYNRYLNNDN